MSETTHLDHLNILVAVADRLSFSAAAQKLGMPKSKVSRAITRLEESLGTQLVQRTTRIVRLTQAGEELVTSVAPHIAALRAAVSTIPEQREAPAGELRVAMPGDLGVAWLADVIARFCLRYPDVRVAALVSPTVVDLVAEGVDLAFRIGRGALKDSTLIARRVSGIELQLFAAPTYVARRGQPESVASLGHQDWVCTPGILDAMRFEVPQSRVRATADDFGVLRGILRSGLGVGVLPSFFAQRDVSTGALVRVLPSWSEPRGVLFLVQPRAQHVPLRVRAFREFVLQELAARPLT